MKNRPEDTGRLRIHPRKEKGELLHPRLFDEKETKKAKRKLGIRGYAGQYQQEPAPESGNIFKRHHFHYWLPDTLPDLEYIIGSWDCTFRKSADSDFVVGQTWGVAHPNKYLLGQERRKMSFVDTIAAIREQLRTWPNMRTIVVEAQANGPKIIETLQNEIPQITGWNPQNTSKEARASGGSWAARRYCTAPGR